MINDKNLSHYPDAERDVAWLLDQLAERNARIAELEARLCRGLTERAGNS